MPRQRIDGKAGAHRRAGKVRIGPPCRLRAPVRLQVGAPRAVQSIPANRTPCSVLPPCSARNSVGCRIGSQDENNASCFGAGNAEVLTAVPSSAPLRATRHARPRWRDPSPKRRVQASWRAVAGPGVKGGAAPRQPPQGTHGMWPQEVRRLTGISRARRARRGGCGGSVSVRRIRPLRRADAPRRIPECTDHARCAPDQTERPATAASKHEPLDPAYRQAEESKRTFAVFNMGDRLARFLFDQLYKRPHIIRR